MAQDAHERGYPEQVDGPTDHARADQFIGQKPPDLAMPNPRRIQAQPSQHQGGSIQFVFGKDDGKTHGVDAEKEQHSLGQGENGSEGIVHGGVS